MENPFPSPSFIILTAFMLPRLFSRMKQFVKISLEFWTALPSLGFFESRPPLAAARPKCNSILHLFGEWLFEAAHIGTDAWIQNTKSKHFILITFGELY